MSKSRFSGSAVICLILALISLYVFLTAWKWPFKAALFPVSIAIAVFGMSITGLILVLLGKDTSEGTARDFSLTEVGEGSGKWPTLVALGWIIGFFLLIMLVGFKIAVPLFVFLSCKYQGREKLWVSIVMAGFAWAFFWFLFIWLLNTPMNEGLIQTLLGIV
jgi:hypothetical protein